MRSRSAKILATLGPASRDPNVMRLLSDAGADAFRLNFSHGSHDDHGTNIDIIRRVEVETGRAIAAVADVQGPKLRCGTFEGGSVDLRYGEEVEIVNAPDGGTATRLPMPHPELFSACEPGAVLKLDDGKLRLTVTEPGAERMRARVDVPGTLSDRKGVNVVNAVLPMSAMTDKDREDIAFALSKGVDYIALSFVQTPDDVREAREMIGDRADIIVKLEKPSAIEHLDDILDLADAAMVARGDLGVELPLEQVPVVQRRIIRECRRRGKPVIVATHMLESMIDAPTPTRAEASDVATAIYQGADAVMLSAETAVGRHPATAVAIMDRIIAAAQGDPDFGAELMPVRRERRAASRTPEDAIAVAVRGMVSAVGASAVVGHTSSGSTARLISRERPPAPILAVTPTMDIARRLALCWGVTPVVAGDPDDFAQMVVRVQDLAKVHMGLETGERLVTVAGIPFGVRGSTNTVNISTVD